MVTKTWRLMGLLGIALMAVYVTAVPGIDYSAMSCHSLLGIKVRPIHAGESKRNVQRTGRCGRSLFRGSLRFGCAGSIPFATDHRYVGSCRGSLRLRARLLGHR